MTGYILVAYGKESLKMHHKTFPFRDLVSNDLYMIAECMKKHRHLFKCLFDVADIRCFTEIWGKMLLLLILKNGDHHPRILPF